MSGPIQVPEVHAKHNAVINWFTVTGTGSISVSFDAASPVKHLICGPNKAYCQAVIDPQAPSGSYQYSVLVSSGNHKQSIDPIVQVDPGMVTWDSTYK